MKTITFTVPDVYGVQWDGEKPYVAFPGHITSEEELEQLLDADNTDTGPAFAVGGGSRRIYNVQCVREAVFADQAGTYSHFTGEL